MAMPAAVKTVNSYPQNNASDHLKSLEVQLKDLWSQYLRRIDEYGFDEAARSLRDRYFNVYRNYRHNLKWRDAMNN